MHALMRPSTCGIQRAALCALFCLLVTAPQAHASIVSAEHVALYEQMDEGQRAQTLIKLAGSGQPDAAQELLDAYPLTGQHGANRTLFIKGLILKARGDLRGAVAKYRAALAGDPRLTLVRSELAQTLLLLEEDDSAKHHLTLLAGETENEKDAAGIRAFIDRIDARKPYNFSGYVSFAPSTNINNGSGQRTVYSPVFGGDIVIDEESRQQEGYSVSAGVNGSYNKQLGNNLALIVAGGIDTRVYDDLKLNGLSFSQSMELRKFLPKGSFGLGMIANQSFDLDTTDFNYVAYGPRVSGRLSLTAKDTLSTSSTYEYRDFNADGAHDGSSWTSDIAWAHAFNSTMTTSAYGGFDRVDNGLDHLNYHTWSGGLQLYKEFSRGISVTTAGELRHSQFEGENALAGKTREDTRLIGGITFTKRDFDIFGFAPALNYTYVRNVSNIELYDYDSHSIDLRLTKDF